MNDEPRVYAPDDMAEAGAWKDYGMGVSECCVYGHIFVPGKGFCKYGWNKSQTVLFAVSAVRYLLFVCIHAECLIFLFRRTVLGAQTNVYHDSNGKKKVECF